MCDARLTHIQHDPTWTSDGTGGNVWVNGVSQIRSVTNARPLTGSEGVSDLVSELCFDDAGDLVVTDAVDSRILPKRLEYRLGTLSEPEL